MSANVVRSDDRSSLINQYYKYIRHLFYSFVISIAISVLLYILSKVVEDSFTLLIANVFAIISLFSGLFNGFRLVMEISFNQVDQPTKTPANAPVTLEMERLTRLSKAASQLPRFGETPKRCQEMQKRDSPFSPWNCSQVADKSSNTSVRSASSLDWSRLEMTNKMWESFGVGFSQRKGIVKAMRFFISSKILEPLIDAVSNGRLSETLNCSQFVEYMMDYPGDRDYVLGRINDMARDQYLSDFVWNGGADHAGFCWSESSLPTDAAIVFHLFHRYMDICISPLSVISGDRSKFSDRHIRISPRGCFNTVAGRDVMCIQQRSISPPDYCVVSGGQLYETDKGMNNLFEAIGLFLIIIRRDYSQRIETKSIGDIIGHGLTDCLS